MMEEIVFERMFLFNCFIWLLFGFMICVGIYWLYLTKMYTTPLDVREDFERKYQRVLWKHTKGAFGPVEIEPQLFDTVYDDLSTYIKEFQRLLDIRHRVDE